MDYVCSLTTIACYVLIIQQILEFTQCHECIIILFSIFILLKSNSSNNIVILLEDINRIWEIHKYYYNNCLKLFSRFIETFVKKNQGWNLDFFYLTHFGIEVNPKFMSEFYCNSLQRKFKMWLDFVIV